MSDLNLSRQVTGASVGRTRLQCAVFDNSPQPLYSADCFASPPYKNEILSVIKPYC